MTQIVPIGPELIHETNLHLGRHVLESGRHGVHWLPYDPLTMARPPAVAEESLTLNFTTPGWERWFVLQTGSTVSGHVAVQGAKFDRGLHRCELGMGLEHHCWRQGWGSKLLSRAIETAESIATVDWFDLRVIDLNAPAISLYLKMGFSEVSRTPDFCRIDGKPVADILMTRSVS